MRAVRQSVDDRNGRVRGELLDVGLGERPDHDRVEIARQHDGCVLDRFAATQLEIARREIEPGTDELVDADLEGDPRSRRGVLEDHSQRPAGQEVMLLTRLLEALELVGEVEDLEQLVRAPIRDARERAPFEGVGDRDHLFRSYGRTRVPASPASAAPSASTLVISVSPAKPSADSTFGRMEPSESSGSNASASLRESSRISV